MREIKFRGKRKDNGYWVYGYYFYSELEFIHLIMIESEKFGFQKIEVDPKTIGQYIGRNDKDGTEIYDGDLMELKNWPYVMEIFFGEDIGVGFGFGWREVDDHRSSGESITGFIDEYKVIGNIHDGVPKCDTK